MDSLAVYEALTGGFGVPTFHGLGANGVVADFGILGVRGGRKSGLWNLLALSDSKFAVKLAFVTPGPESFLGH